MHSPAELIERARAREREAQCQVADLLLRSRQSDRDKAARPWLLSAASAGSFWAQYMVGLSFDHGRGVRRSVSRAIYWYRLSSAHGYASAHLNLGILLANLPGSRRDLSSAIRLYRLAARQAGECRLQPRPLLPPRSGSPPEQPLGITLVPTRRALGSRAAGNAHPPYSRAGLTPACSGLASLALMPDVRRFLPHRMRCPDDDTILAPTRRAGLPLDVCPLCHGLWFDADEIKPFTLHHGRTTLASVRPISPPH